MLRLLSANVKMLLRDRQALFWALVFPLIFVVVFGLFGVGEPDPVDMAIIDLADSPISRSIRSELSEIDLLDITDEFATESKSREAVEDGDLEYALIIPATVADISRTSSQTAPVPLTIYFDQSNLQFNQLVFGVVRQTLGRANLELAGAPQRIALRPQIVQEDDVDYFDVLLVGLVGMGVMFNSILVIGVKLTSYRQQRVLRRILVTPLKVRNYFASVVLTHLALALVQAGIILAVGVFAFGGQIFGNIVWLFIIIALADLVFLNIGFAIGGWSRSPAAASGLGNVIAMPMMFFSGTFFPTSSLPAFLPDLVKVLPLTPTLEAMRAVAIDGQAIWQTWPELAMLVGWVAFSAAVATKVFRFD